MNKYLKGFLLMLLALVLIIVTAPLFGWLHNRFIEKISGSWIGTDDVWIFIVGLFYGYIFSVSLLLSVFGGKYRHAVIFFLVGLELLLFWGVLSMFLSSLILSLLTITLGETINFIIKKSKKK